jgi:hypothetical protein
MKTLALIILTMVLAPFAAHAGEEELYAPVPPADSSFIRVVNLTDTPDAQTKIDDATIPPGMENAVSEYVVIKAGERSFHFNDKKEPVSIEAGQYYTIAVSGDGSVKVFKDALIKDPAKAVIYFYNLSDAADATLTAPSHNTAIFEKVAANDSKSREINAVTFGLKATAKGKDAGTVDEVELKRGRGTSLFLTGPEGNYKFFSVQNTVKQ